MGRLTLLAVVIETCLMVHALPIVDPGLFVIMGVQSCRDGKGYCLLGQDCSLDNDFLSDDLGGHCDGLRSAFTPSAPFVCCRFSGDATTTEMSPTTTDMSPDTDGTTIALPLNDEDRMKPKITTKRSYDVHEEPLEVTNSSEKNPLNRSSRLDDTKKENDGPLHVELTVDGFVEDDMKEYKKNSSSTKNKHRLDNDTVLYEENRAGLADAQSPINNITVPRGNMSTEPIVCVLQPRKLEERGPLTFPRCEPLSSTTLPTAINDNSTAKPSPYLDNQIQMADRTIRTKGDSRSTVQLSTEIYVDSKAGIMELENNDVTGSVAARNGLPALENTDSANGTAYSSNDYKMRSDNSSDIDSILKAVSNAVKSFDTSSNKYTFESTTTDKNIIKETTTTADDDPISSSVMHDATTEYISECEEGSDGSCNDYVDDTSTTIMNNVFTSAEDLEDDNHSKEGSTLTRTTTTLMYDTESTLLTEVTPTSDVENIDSTTPTPQGKTPGTISLISMKSSTTQRTAASSPSTGTSSPIQSPASTSALPSTTSATESSSKSNEMETTESTTELAYTYTSNTETQETIANTSDYNEMSTNAFSDNVTPASADISTSKRDKANISVCIGRRQATPGNECWLIQFQDSRSNSTVCPGALLTAKMVITSASCAIRLFNVGMEQIEVMHVDGSSTSQRVRSIIVHENYRPDRSRPPRYDLGVIHLTPSQQRRQKTCAVCVAEPKMDVKVQRCRAAVRNSAKEESEAQRECKQVTPSGRRLGSVMTMCSKTSPSAPKVPSGSPLICNGMLAGVAFSWDRGQAFTPVNLFTTWIKNNHLAS